MKLTSKIRKELQKIDKYNKEAVDVLAERNGNTQGYDGNRSTCSNNILGKRIL